MAEDRKTTCTISKNIDLEFMSVHYISILKHLWASPGCEFDNAGKCYYTFECKGEMPSPEELKEANELLERVNRRIMDLHRIITVVKAITSEEKRSFEAQLRESYQIRRLTFFREIEHLSEQVNALELQVKLLNEFMITSTEPESCPSSPVYDPLEGLRGKVGRHTELALERWYKENRDKDVLPVDKLTDSDILSIYNIGRKSLAEIREIIPKPE